MGRMGFDVHLGLLFFFTLTQIQIMILVFTAPGFPASVHRIVVIQSIIFITSLESLLHAVHIVILLCDESQQRLKSNQYFSSPPRTHTPYIPIRIQQIKILQKFSETSEQYMLAKLY